MKTKADKISYTKVISFACDLNNVCMTGDIKRHNPINKSAYMLDIKISYILTLFIYFTLSLTIPNTKSFPQSVKLKKPPNFYCGKFYYELTDKNIKYNLIKLKDLL